MFLISLHTQILFFFFEMAFLVLKTYKFINDKLTYFLIYPLKVMSHMHNIKTIVVYRELTVSRQTDRTTDRTTDRLTDRQSLL